MNKLDIYPALPHVATFLVFFPSDLFTALPFPRLVRYTVIINKDDHTAVHHGTTLIGYYVYAHAIILAIRVSPTSLHSRATTRAPNIVLPQTCANNTRVSVRCAWTRDWDLANLSTCLGRWCRPDMRELG